ncbi:hypothetical protein NDN08_002942 [Rhodosorus marinus]|uniref:Uncharacterized protein n=1 Tax=Rhodosorus marinus TaxID=101924 RepID=A0AAV8UVC4_9RHOD|nr:hypothetical protein NDN08_002942 [Rhodosorus marinus]
MDRPWVEQKEDGSEIYHGSRGAIFEGVRWVFLQGLFTFLSSDIKALLDKRFSESFGFLATFGFHRSMKKGLKRGLQAKGKGVEQEPYHYSGRVDPCINQLDKYLKDKSMANVRSYLHCISVPAWQRRQEQIDLGLIKQHQSVRIEDDVDEEDR